MAWWNFGGRTGGVPVRADACEWAMMQGQVKGKPAYVRLNQSLQSHAPLEAFHHEVMVIIHFQQVGDDGMPLSQDDLDGAGDLEDMVKKHLEADGTAIMALAVTNGGVRELYFYSSAPKGAIEQWEQKLQPTIQSHQVEFGIQPDREWRAYKSFARALG